MKFHIVKLYVIMLIDIKLHTSSSLYYMPTSSARCAPPSSSASSTPASTPPTSLRLCRRHKGSNKKKRPCCWPILKNMSVRRELRKFYVYVHIEYTARSYSQLIDGKTRLIETSLVCNSFVATSNNYKSSLSSNYIYLSEYI